MILIDNYDSFTYNLVQYFKELGVEPRVFKNDEITIQELKRIDFSSIVISPGPNNPDNAGISLEVIKEFYKTKKILGVCLGHQCIAQFFGAKIVKANEPVHGKVSKIHFKPDALFNEIEQGFEATRYHSLIVENESLPKCLIKLAYTDPSPEFLKLVPHFEIHPSPSRGEERSDASRFTPHAPPLMALKHKDYPIYGVQFHPEAILTQYGKKLMENFLNIS